MNLVELQRALRQLGAIEVAHFLRTAEAEVVRLTARYLARHQLGADATAFIRRAHAPRRAGGCAAHEPALLRSSTFRGELVLLLELHLRR